MRNRLATTLLTLTLALFGSGAGDGFSVPRVVRLFEAVQGGLNVVPEARARLHQARAPGDAMVIALPTAQGMQRFRLEDSGVMAPGLATRYPQIRSYRGKSLDVPGTAAALSIGPTGVHAVVSGVGGVRITPVAPGSPLHRLQRRGDRGRAQPWQCETATEPETELRFDKLAEIRHGKTLRTYRAAFATSPRYTSLHGGTVVEGLAAVVAVVTQLNVWLERDLSVRLELIENNDELIHTNTLASPYSDGDTLAMSQENQRLLDRTIGDANYDIGHVLGIGGIAGRSQYLGEPCQSGRKGAAASINNSAEIIDFARQIVIHEVGHQLAARHSFNGTTGNCSEGRTQVSAWEPGSGSTIMSYAGLCGAENIATASDSYFHVGSIGEMVEYVDQGPGASCGRVTKTGNKAPRVDAGSDYQVPAMTPLELVGSGSDRNGDALSFTWEQLDAGAASPPATDDGTRALFRSWEPVAGATRVVPRLRDVVRGRTTAGETWATTDRDLTLRLAARDGRGGVGTDTVILEVVAAAGPFRVLTADATWSSATAVVDWEVAGTNRKPIRCRRVDIDLSTDGGKTFAVPLARRTRNDGSETVDVPPIATRKARVRVRCADNVFFAVSAQDFEITR